ncbi:ester cyclase [Yoonia sp. SS1-5]|uniref:Ester cyclase n=1 Tax=Yoonia rhodophyticola TaxID=3137370 RepID=A0AAN0NK83_9RHOB
MKWSKMLVSAVAAIAIAGTAHADDLQTVKSFYENLLTTPADADLAAVTSVVADDWKSTPTPLGGPGAEGFLTTLNAFGGLIPDLKWEVQEIWQDGDTYIVRGRATGTPQGPFLGIDPATGKSFDIMSIDIHRVEDGKLKESYHIEDWMSALAQLTAE